MADSKENTEIDTFRILLNRIREGDHAAQSDLVNQLQSYVIMMADRNLYQDIRAGIGPSDVAQNSMIKMLDAIDQYQGNSSSEFFGWLNRIIENEVKQSHRDLTRQKRDIRRRTSLGAIVDDSQLNLEPEECQLTPQSNALAAERVEIFHAARKKPAGGLPNGHTPAQSGTTFIPGRRQKDGCSKDSVSKLWYRAVMKLKQELEALDDNSRQR